MANEIDPKDLAKELLGGETGLPTFCVDGRRCGLGMLCEFAQERGGQSKKVESLWTSHKNGDCENYRPRKELGSAGDVPKSRPGYSRHNKHAFQKKPGKHIGTLTTSDLPEPPDLMVKRHIRNGHNIKGDD